ncbi:hypothetical protein [Bradyrhizobium sp. CCGB12]|uniref:hypothetical protein n=1 Tax=Bradyrhizobium sp. CCGB12 TaxID=2949632 RepID=UPI002812762C|nr:hypothetical protein [Bradyrhizobium sp. CCGB12]
MQRDFFRGWRFILQLLHYPRSFGIQGCGSGTKNGWIAVSLCNRIDQSFDFPV